MHSSIQFTKYSRILLLFVKQTSIYCIRYIFFQTLSNMIINYFSNCKNKKMKENSFIKPLSRYYLWKSDICLSDRKPFTFLRIEILFSRRKVINQKLYHTIFIFEYRREKNDNDKFQPFIISSKYHKIFATQYHYKWYIFWNRI